MPPDFPPPSVHSMSAVGKLGSEYPYQQNYDRGPDGRFLKAKRFTIGKRLHPIKHPTSVYTACTAGSLAITAMWNGMDQAHRNTWIGHAKRWQVPVRIAFGQYNMRRVVKGLPIIDHPPD